MTGETLNKGSISVPTYYSWEVLGTFWLNSFTACKNLSQVVWYSLPQSPRYRKDMSIWTQIPQIRTSSPICASGNWFSCSWGSCYGIGIEVLERVWVLGVLGVIIVLFLSNNVLGFTFCMNLSSKCRFYNFIQYSGSANYCYNSCCCEQKFFPLNLLHLIHGREMLISSLFSDSFLPLITSFHTDGIRAYLSFDVQPMT